MLLFKADRTFCHYDGPEGAMDRTHWMEGALAAGMGQWDLRTAELDFEQEDVIEVDDLF